MDRKAKIAFGLGVTIWALGFGYCASAEPLVDYPLTTRYGWVGEERAFSWQHDGASVTRFELEVTHIENRIVTPITRPATARSATFTPTRAGHYTFRVRACNGDECSDWGELDDSGYWIFVWLKPPSF